MDLPTMEFPMAKSNSMTPSHGETATGSDLQRILGDMDASTAVAILSLRPSITQVEEARVWLDGEGDVLGKERRPLDGVVARIFDMLKVEEEDPIAAARG
jgi:hypothetical protein